VRDLPSVTVADLYEEYADFNVQVEREQGRLSLHDVLVWQFPLYMYAPPALVKQWLELVLEFGWAYGRGGGRLAGKKAVIAVTTGGSRDSYSLDGPHRYSLRDFLRPLEQIFLLCRMTPLPPFVIHGTYRLSTEEVAAEARTYRLVMEALAEPIRMEDTYAHATLNDWVLTERGGK